MHKKLLDQGALNERERHNRLSLPRVLNRFDVRRWNSRDGWQHQVQDGASRLGIPPAQKKFLSNTAIALWSRTATIEVVDYLPLAHLSQALSARITTRFSVDLMSASTGCLFSNIQP